MKKILIAENNQDFAYALQWFLHDKGYEVRLTANGSETLDLFLSKSPDLVILDIHLDDDINGKDVAKSIKQHDGTVPIIFMSGESKSPQDVVEGFKIGCDFFLKKPITLEEIGVHIDRALQNGIDADIYRFAQTTIHTIERTIRCNNAKHHLSDKENRVLENLAQKFNQTVPQKTLMLYGWNNEYSDESLRNIISSLRKKLVDTDLQIFTQKAIGYRLEYKVAPSGDTVF